MIFVSNDKRLKALFESNLKTGGSLKIYHFWYSMVQILQKKFKAPQSEFELKEILVEFKKLVVVEDVNINFFLKL